MFGMKTRITKKKHRRVIQSLSQEILSHRFAMDYHADAAEKASRKLWDALMDILPDMDTEAWEYGFDHNKLEVYVRGRTKKAQIEKRLAELNGDTT